MAADIAVGDGRTCRQRSVGNHDPRSNRASKNNYIIGSRWPYKVVRAVEVQLTGLEILTLNNLSSIMGSIIRDSLEDAQSLVISSLDMLSPELHEINKAIHSHPETCYQEFFAHDTITAYLEKKGFKVRRRTYGLDTSFEAQIGEGGRQVVFCTEYDALPGIGHACGHNLIATASIGAFLATCHAFKELKISGRVRILGTPAEEGGGGKAKLIDAGAFNPPEDVAAAIMAHPASSKGNLGGGGDNEGLAGMKLIAAHKFKVEFEGKPAHAAAEPWNGVNALDASVATYNNIAMLRQHIRPDERIHAIIEQGGLSQNVIADYARMSFNVRAPTIKRADALLARVKHCIEGGGLAAGCKLTWTW